MAMLFAFTGFSRERAGKENDSIEGESGERAKENENERESVRERPMLAYVPSAAS